MKKRLLSLIALVACSVMLFTMTACGKGIDYSVYSERSTAHAFTSGTQVTELDGYSVDDSSNRFVLLYKVDTNNVKTHKVFDLEEGKVVATYSETATADARVTYALQVANNLYYYNKTTANLVNDIKTDECKIYNEDGKIILEKTVENYTDVADAINIFLGGSNGNKTIEAIIINEEVYDFEDGKLRFAYNRDDIDLSSLASATSQIKGDYIVYEMGREVYAFNWKMELTCYYKVPTDAGSDYEFIFLDNGDFIVQYELDDTFVFYGLKTYEDIMITELVSAKDGGVKKLNCKYVLDKTYYTANEAEKLGFVINGYDAIMFGVDSKIDGIDYIDLDVVLGIKENGTIEEIDTLIDYQKTELSVSKIGNTYVVQNVLGQTYVLDYKGNVVKQVNLTGAVVSEQNYIRDGKLYDLKFNELEIPKGYTVAGLLPRAVILSKEAKVDNAVIGTEYYLLNDDGTVTLIGTDKNDGSEKVDSSDLTKVVTGSDGVKTYTYYNVEGKEFITINCELNAVAGNADLNKALLQGELNGANVFLYAK